MKKNFVITKKNKWLLLVLIGFIGLVSLFFALRAFLVITPVTSQTTKYDYMITPVIDYQVNLEKNDFITEPSLPAGQVYLHDVVKNIDFSFQIEVEGDQISDTVITGETYNELQGLLTTESGESSVLWKRDYIMEDKKTKVGDNAEFGSQVVLGDYETDAELAQSQLGYNGDTALQVICDGVVSFMADGKQIQEPFHYSLSVPLNASTFTITESDNQPISQCMTQDVSQSGVRDSRRIWGCTGVFLLCVVWIILVLMKSREPDREDLAAWNLKKKLKAAGVIVPLIRDPDMKERKGTEVKQIGDLIELSHQLQQPILNFKENYYLFDNQNLFWCTIGESLKR